MGRFFLLHVPPHPNLSQIGVQHRGAQAGVSGLRPVREPAQRSVPGMPGGRLA